MQTRCLCLKKGRMNITKNLGMLLLAIYLILAGITLAVPHHYPDNHNGNPGAGSGHFDSHWQIATSLGPDLHDDPFKRDG